MTDTLKTNWLLFAIFILGILIRFLYFPENVYFAYDQARDSYTSLEILKGDFKIVGPPSAASEKLFAGPLIFYIYAPLYWVGDKNPEIVSAFLRIYNALGVLIVFFIGKILFNRFSGLLVALFFAVSYEQSQYSLFISHQPLAVIPILIFYLGLALLIFKKDRRGILLIAVGWGLALQFHYVYVLLGTGILSLFIFYRKNLPTLGMKTIFGALGVFLLTISTYILSEIKFDFRVSKTLLAGSGAGNLHPETVVFVINRFLHDTFLANYSFTSVVAVILLFGCFVLYLNKAFKSRLLFLIVWLVTGTLPYFLSGTSSYYYSAAASVSLIMLASFVVFKIKEKGFVIALLIIVGILVNNLKIISKINPDGLNSDMVIQPGMLVSSQKQVLDYIYGSSGNMAFAVRSLTIPYNINVTWNYLFEWYGQQKYNKLPLWVGPVASGYAGRIPVINARSELPDLQFLIMEPTVGIDNYTLQKFFNEEDYFSKVLEEKQFGTIRVQKRVRI